MFNFFSRNIKYTFLADSSKCQKITCMNGGTCNTISGTCDCAILFYGTTCENCILYLK